MKLFHGLKQKLISQREMDDSEIERINRISMLTPREKELFLLLVEGYTLKESAKQLSVKYSTANTHMTSIYKKLNVNSRAGLIIQYRDAGRKLD